MNYIEPIDELNFLFDFFQAVQKNHSPKTFGNTPLRVQSSVNMIFRINPQFINHKFGGIKSIIQEQLASHLVATAKDVSLPFPRPLDEVRTTIMNNIVWSEVLQRPSHLVEVLLMKRSENKYDRHSGQICLPGGKCDNSETDYQAAVREAAEEIGIDFMNTKKFAYIGRLPRNFYLYKYKDDKYMHLTIHVWMVLTNVSISPEHYINSASAEVSLTFWQPFFDLVNKQRVVQKKFKLDPRWFGSTMTRVINLLGSNKDGMIGFNGIQLENSEFLWGITKNVFMFTFDLLFSTLREIKQKGETEGLEKEFHEVRKAVNSFSLGPNGNSMMSKVISKINGYAWLKQYEFKEEEGGIDLSKWSLAAYFATLGGLYAGRKYIFGNPRL